MGKPINKNNLGYLGIEFQYKLAKVFIEEPKIFEDIASIVDQNAFTDVLLRNFIGIVKDYYTNNGVVPSYDLIAIILREKSKVDTDIEEYEALIKKIRFETTTEGCEMVKDTAIKFFKQQNLVKVANKILEIASKGDIERYPECQQLMDDAALVGNEEDFGYNIYELQDKALSKDYTVSIPTGVDKLDEVLGGGLDKGKLGLIIAPAGFGKTSLTTAIDAYAATYKCDMNNHQGFKVLQIYFEDDDVDITRKHFSRITQTEARFMKRLDDPQKEEIENWLSNFEDKELIKKNLRLKRFKTGTKSASDIEIFVKRLINSGFKPDLISIDYFECLASEPSSRATDSEWNREGVTMRKLESMAHDLDCAIWIPTQGTKDSMNSPDVVRMDQASGSGKKIHVAQLIISIARAINDIDKSRAVIAILKNRSGKSGKIFNNVYFNNGTSTISCSEVEEYDDALAWENDNELLKEKNRIERIRNIRSERRANQQNTSDLDNKVEGNCVGKINK